MTFSDHYLWLMHFSKAQIAALKSTVLIAFRTPPPVLPLTEGGGPKSEITFAQIWTVQKGARQSMVYIECRTPPSILPLMEGGGSEIGVKKRTEICGQKSSAQINGSW